MDIESSPSPVIIVADKPVFMAHQTGENHPESPNRIEAIEAALKKNGLMNASNTISPRKANLEELTLCHSMEYIQELKRQIDFLPKNVRTAAFDPHKFNAENVFSDFQISPFTWDAALAGAGAPLTAIDYILKKENKATRAFCIVRPPGHHAHKNSGSGFCVFNNVAIAAKYLTKNLGLKKVLIVDWDGHHGDGTQDLTEEDPSIFYFSTHRDTTIGNGFYPGPFWGRPDQRGKGSGLGTVLNCPVYGTPGECREGIFDAFRNQLIPAMEKFQPDFVLISCGFDAHKDDPLVGLGLDDEDFGELTLICAEIANKYASGRIVSVLEGGYNLNALGKSSQQHVKALQAPPR